jgi:hypothetical protein
MQTHHSLDDWTTALYLEVAREKIVLLQAYFEASEGLGTVRTLDVSRGIVTVITTPDEVGNCLALLESVRPFLPWRLVEGPSSTQSL